MANQSIYAAFERFWQHVLAAIGDRIGDVEGALDKIIEIQNKLVGVTLISFTINDNEYQTEEGMTWGEWVDSEYNTGEFSNVSDYISTPDGASLWDLNDNEVTSDMVIIANGAYSHDY